MFFQFINGRASGRAKYSPTKYSLIFVIVSSLIPAVCFAASSRSAEVAAVYKAEGMPELQLASFENELLDCSALAAIHMWIGDNLGDNSGAEVRKKLNNDYWIDLSKGYLSLAQEASDEADLSQQLGVRMRALSAEFRDLTESQAEPESWANWYDLIDRCDTWRPEKPAHAFYNNGRSSVVDVKQQSPGIKAPT